MLQVGHSEERSDEKSAVCLPREKADFSPGLENSSGINPIRLAHYPSRGNTQISGRFRYFSA